MTMAVVGHTIRLFLGESSTYHPAPSRSPSVGEKYEVFLSPLAHCATRQAAHRELAQSLLAAPLSAARAGGQLKPRARHGMVASRNPAPFNSGQQHGPLPTQSSHIATKRTAAAAEQQSQLPRTSFILLHSIPLLAKTVTLKSSKRGPKEGAMQGKGWEMYESKRSQEENIDIFNTVKKLFDLENPRHKPTFTEFRTTAKRNL